MATNEMAKGGGIKQSKPQETDSTYSKAIDKQVAGKPVGWRFTDKLAKKLGKKAGTKPTAAEIEKYKNRGVYFETRKNKSDINPKAKLEGGGLNEKTSDKKRFFQLASKLGLVIDGKYISGIPKGSPKDIDEFYKLEDKLDYPRPQKAKLEGGGENEYAKGGQTAPQRESYSKRGDKEVKAKPVGYRFTEKLANRLGKNVFTKPTQEQVEKYRGKGVYFENRKDKSDINPRAMFEGGGHSDEILSDGSKLTSFEAVGIAEGFVENNNLLDQIKAWAYIQRHNMTRSLQGWFGRNCEAMIDRGIFDRDGNIDYDVVDEISMGSDEYAKGGQTAPQRESYSKRGDKEVKAKPVGYRFTEKLANRLGKNVFTKPTQEQVEKYRGKGVYFENRKDKSDINPRAMFEDGGDMEYAKGGKIDNQYTSIKRSYVWGKVDGVWNAWNPKQRGHFLSDHMDEFEEKGSFRFSDFSVGQVSKMNWENLVDKDDDLAMEIADVLRDHIEMGQYAKGGQTAPQRESYSKRGDAEVKAKPVGYRFTNALAKRLGKSVSTKPTAEQVRKYLGKGVYFENRKDKSDIKPASYLAKGGQTAPQETDSTYSKSIDKQVSGKPVGYRFTNKLANKLGKKQYTKPTSAEIEKYSGKGVYFETRKNKSDLNPKAKLEGGGESEYARGGGVPRTSNADSKAYTENHLPFMANNLEGKTLENGDYVVLSYGYYPIWFWHKRTNKWYGNKDKFSVTTAKHISQSRPTYEAEMLSRGEMDNLMSKSIEGKDFKEMGGALDSFVVAQQ